MALIRTWHAYLGILIAPSVLFFALTGALQLFGLHEPHDGYQPIAVVEKLGKLHTDQAFVLSKHHEPPPQQTEAAGAEDKQAPPPAPEDAPALGTTLLKWFFLLVALGLATSTSLGLWMGLTHVRHRRAGWWLLALGIVLPVTLTLA
jgi:hypothetical protein